MAKGQEAEEGFSPEANGKVSINRTVLAGLIAAMLLLAVVAVMEEVEVNDLESSQSSMTNCIVPAEGEAYLLVVSDYNQQPIPGLAVASTPVSILCPKEVTSTTTTYATNSTGWAFLGWAPSDVHYELLVFYEGRDYNIWIPLGPEDDTYATLSLPSGALNLTLCYTMGPFTCQPYNQAITPGSTSPGAASYLEEIPHF